LESEAGDEVRPTVAELAELYLADLRQRAARSEKQPSRSP
jgi:hypothetical protein